MGSKKLDLKSLTFYGDSESSGTPDNPHTPDNSRSSRNKSLRHKKAANSISGFKCHFFTLLRLVTAVAFCVVASFT